MSDSKSITSNKYFWLIASGLIMSIVGFAGGQITSILTLPEKVKLLEYRLEKIEAMTGTIETKTSSVEQATVRVETKVDLLLKGGKY